MDDDVVLSGRRRRCFIRMGGWTNVCFIKIGRTTLFYKDGWTDDVVLSGWMDGRRCFIRMGGWTDDVVL